MSESRCTALNSHLKLLIGCCLCAGTRLFEAPESREQQVAWHPAVGMRIPNAGALLASSQQGGSGFLRRCEREKKKKKRTEGGGQGSGVTVLAGIVSTYSVHVLRKVRGESAAAAAAAARVHPVQFPSSIMPAPGRVGWPHVVIRPKAKTKCLPAASSHVARFDRDLHWTRANAILFFFPGSSSGPSSVLV